MFNSSRNSRLAAERSAERRQREDEAPRLRLVVPKLRELRVAVVEHAPVTTIRYTKHVIVDRAPALFIYPCGDPRCVDGGHNVTTSILHALRDSIPSFHGEHPCEGMLGSAPCGRHIEFTAEARFAAVL